MGRIVSIVYTPLDIEPRPADHYARIPLQRATLVPDKGIDGDRKGTKNRQLNVMAEETLAGLQRDGFNAGFGEMGEQIVLSDIDVNRLAPGTRLALGSEAIIEVLEARTGCPRLEGIQKRPRAVVAGRLGVLAKVVGSGVISVGDWVVIMPQ